MQKILLLSDPHLGAAGLRHQGRDPHRALAAAIDDINAHHADAALVVICGDLVHDDAAAYPALAAHLDRLAPPLRAGLRMTLGNHDLRPDFLAAFPGSGDADGHAQSVAHLPGLDVVLLDTLAPGAVAGRLCARRLGWLEARLAQAAGRDVMICLHHPPMALGLPALDACRLEARSADALARLCAAHGRVRQLCAGHVHRPASGLWRGIPFATLRSTCHQSALNFGPGFAGAEEAPGYAVLLIGGAETRLHFRDLPPPAAG